VAAINFVRQIHDKESSCSLLRAPCERPHTRAADVRDELAPFHHSITSSAATSSLSGTVRAKRLRGLEVDDELEARRLKDRQVGRFLALEDAPA
jgi:hypothetical protein